MDKDFPNTIRDYFGKAGFEEQEREENYDFDPEDDLPLLVVIAQMNRAINNLEVENNTFNDFVKIDKNLFLEDEGIDIFRLVMY